MLQKNFTTVVMEESMNKQSGFTLIELIVTMCLSGVFLSFALQYYLSALRVEKNIREDFDSYFDYNVKKAAVQKLLKNKTGLCSGGIYFVSGTDSVSSVSEIPLKSWNCHESGEGRRVLYYQGHAEYGKKKRLIMLDFIQNR